ncbi:sensor domain-containing diguanylate cyclase [Neobacillus drentensis]|uniref:sensor domain-containing diguanylate cyclase n=1 Tax=Neobacillus drentensis TaxID=220684 RepID=UPI0030004F60
MNTFVLSFIAGGVVGVIGFGIYHYYDKNKKRKQKMEEDKRFSGLVASSKDIIYYFEKVPGFRFRYMLPSLEHFYGEEMGRDGFVDPKKYFYLVHPDDLDMFWKKIHGEVDYSKPIIYRIRNREGKYNTYEEYTTPVYKDGEIIALQGILRNINEKIKLQNELEYRINHDDLTGLFNRGYFEKQLDKYANEMNTPVAIVICDLDDLKYVNDSFGHKAGDLLIKTTASILKEFSSDTVIPSRLGGDEFALLIVGNSSLDDVESLVGSIENKVNTYRIDSISQSIKLSIGFAYSNDSLNEMDRLFIEADKNMYKNKKQKKSRTLLAVEG